MGCGKYDVYGVGGWVRERERYERERGGQEAPLALRPPLSSQTPGHVGVCEQRQEEIDLRRHVLS